jgi:hypothetical protein
MHARTKSFLALLVDGSGFTLAEPFTCTTKTLPILPKFKDANYPS